jgi:hypothetical protein
MTIGNGVINGVHRCSYSGIPENESVMLGRKLINGTIEAWGKMVQREEEAAGILPYFKVPRRSDGPFCVESEFDPVPKNASSENARNLAKSKQRGTGDFA